MLQRSVIPMKTGIRNWIPASVSDYCRRGNDKKRKHNDSKNLLARTSHAILSV